jgi:hypothetical protein
VRSSSSRPRRRAGLPGRPAWPQPLPNNWILGQVSGVAVDADDHVWVLQRPRSLTEDEGGAALNPPQSNAASPRRRCSSSTAAAGAALVGRPGAGYDWPGNEHGIHVDPKGFVWVTGNGENDGQILKFTPDGKFVLQIGKVGPADEQRRHDAPRPAGQRRGRRARPTRSTSPTATRNRRVIVFDADSGAYKRHWGAYGRPPSTGAKPTGRRTRRRRRAAAAVRIRRCTACAIARDGLVYVCDRLNNRIQVFRKDGSFVRSSPSSRAPRATARSGTSCFARPAAAWLHLADGRNNQVADARARDRRGRRHARTLGPLCGRVPLGPRPGDRLEGQSLRGRGRHGKRVQRFVRK